MILALSRSLYLPEAVDAAVAAYGAVAKVEARADGNDIVVQIDPLDAESLPDDIEDAFANHALYETVVRHRTQAGA